jgi:transcriptional regulator with XRE-family HTH domain
MPGRLQDSRYAAFIESLRNYRIQLGVTQTTLADRLGRPQSYVSKIERRERRLDIVEFTDWSQALCVQPDVMLRALSPDLR